MLTALLTATNVPERESFDMKTANALDRLLSRMSAVQRYRIARKYVYGRVADAACGCGYGSWIISKCPAVTKVRGFDNDAAALIQAEAEFGEFATFRHVSLCAPVARTALMAFHPDVVLSLETIEHLTDGWAFVQAVKESGAQRFVVSFPSFPTTTFNPYHLHDWTVTEMNKAVGTEPHRAMLLDDAVWLLVYDL